MTVTYTSEVTTSRKFGCFLKLLLRWRGSIYKIVWADLLVFLSLYYILRIIYEFVLYTEEQKTYFKNVVAYCDKYGSLIPLSFVLGFYVNIVMTRWWNQYSSIPFPDNLSILVGASIQGQDDCARMVRRSIVRYACLSFTITLTMMSPKVKKRFPTREHLIEAGLLTEDEKKIIEELDNEFPGYSKYWLPLAWASNIATRSRHEGLIRSDETLMIILEELNHFRSKLGGMLDYDWISIPLVYTQVVTLAVYSYFAIAVVGTQYIDDTTESLHAYFPFLPTLEFFFYMGWLKVAETLINPYGEDDDDFEVAWMVDRHLQVSYLLVDKIHQEHPKLMKDQYWAKKAPVQLPHTIASIGTINEYPVASTDRLTVKTSDQHLIIPHEKVDGIKASGSFLQKFFRSTIRNRKRLSNIPLTRVSFGHKKSRNHIDEVNDNIINDSNNITGMFNNKEMLPGNNEEFEKLKQKREEEHRRNYKHFLNLSPENQCNRLNSVRYSKAK